MFNPCNTHTSTLSSHFGGPKRSNFGIDIGFTRIDYLLPTTSTGEGTSNSGLAIRVDNEEEQENEENKENEKGV